MTPIKRRSVPARLRSWTAAVLLTAVGVPILCAQSSDIDTLPVHGQVSLVSAGGTNVLVQVGLQGALVVDT